MSTEREEENDYDIWATDLKTGEDVHVYTEGYDVPSTRRLLWKAQRDNEGGKYYKDIRVVRTHTVTTVTTDAEVSEEILAPITEEEAAQFENDEMWFDGGW